MSSQAVVEQIDQRLEANADERQRLEAAKSALLNGSARPGRKPGRKPGPKPGRKPAAAASPKRRRRQGGTRAEQAVKILEKDPGLNATGIAEKMGIGPNYLYRVLSDLEKQGRIRKDGLKCFPVEQPAAAA